MRICLTGSTGFVGRQIARALLASGHHQLRLLIRAGSRARLPVDEDAVEVIEVADLFDAPDRHLQTWVKDTDLLIHAAWYTLHGRYLQAPENLDCLNGSVRLARAFAAMGGRRFVGLGTCFEYDLTPGYLHPATPLRPITLYGATKASLFLTLQSFCASVGVEFLWCRLFYLYGEGEDERRLVPYIRRCLRAGEPVELTSGHQQRDYLDVVVAGEKIAAAALGADQGACNICSGVAISVRALAERLADEYQRRDLLRFGARPQDPADPPCVVGITDSAERRT